MLNACNFVKTALAFYSVSHNLCCSNIASQYTFLEWHTDLFNPVSINAYLSE